LLRDVGMSTRFANLLLLLGLAGCREGSSSASERVTYSGAPTDVAVTQPEAPCRGCTIDTPPTRQGDLPLLVVLHGNKEHAPAAAARWREAALERGWALLSLECPREDGCEDGKWYAWNGAPSWVQQQVDAIAQQLPIDPSKRFLAGWSGGASYIGMNAYRLNGFAAVVFHGGGQPPLGTEDCPANALPAYFLVGDGNPTHGAAIRLKTYLEKCGQELSWDVLRGAGHYDEAKALDHDKAHAILDWLDQRASAHVGALPIPRGPLSASS
jgi:poly(3-hydroxybutyrate) depolymerase